MANVPSVNDLNFDQEVVNSDLPVLVDFSATWCGPCKQIAPFVEQLSAEYEGQVKVRMVDIDESPGTAAKYGVRGVPTLKVFKGGEVVAEQVGAAPKAKLVDLIKRAL
ncbi:MAG: thioredoxin [Myxococcota bacterium]